MLKISATIDYPPSFTKKTLFKRGASCLVVSFINEFNTCRYDIRNNFNIPPILKNRKTFYIADTDGNKKTLDTNIAQVYEYYRPFLENERKSMKELKNDICGSIPVGASDSPAVTKIKDETRRRAARIVTLPLAMDNSNATIGALFLPKSSHQRLLEYIPNMLVLKEYAKYFDKPKYHITELLVIYKDKLTKIN